MSASLMPWVVFNLFVLLMLALDLFVFHKSAHEVKLKEAMGWSVFWITLSLLFCGYLWISRGSEDGFTFLAGYLVEKSLSVDNLFVFLLIFSSFKIPKKNQHRVLFWGILGALVLRALFIFAGVALLERFAWVMYVFGGFLIFTGLKMGFSSKEEVALENKFFYKFFKKVMPIDDHYSGDRFFIKNGTKRFVTKMFLVLLLVEVSDLIFALDSIPAVLAISHDSYIVYTSNIFAILGLRSLYFALAGFMDMFEYLKYALSVILSFIGAKMCLHDYVHVPVGYTLAFIALVITVAVLASIKTNAAKHEKAKHVV